MINYFLGLFSYDLGIDLGTANTLVYVAGKGIAVREPSVIARNKKTKEVLAVGNQAAKMMGKTGSTIEVFRPLKGGVIADFHGASALLTYFIKKVHETGQWYPRIPRPKVVIGIPGSITDVERKAVIEVALKAGARKVYLVEETIAAAIGCNLKIKQDNAHAVIDIGGGTTDIAFIVGGKIVLGKSIKTAGDAMDEALIEYIKLKYSLAIGQPTAEKTKIALADARPAKEVFHVLRGRDLETGLPKSLRVTNFEVYDGISECLAMIYDAIHELFLEAPPELVSDIVRSGVVLAGGGALIKNLNVYLAKQLEVAVTVSDDPLTAVVRGCGKLLNDPSLLRTVAYKPERTIR